MRLPTRRVHLSPREVDLLVPGLDALVNRFASAKRGSFPVRDPMYAMEHPEICDIPFDRDIAGYVLSARNAVKWINPSRQRRFNFIESAALGVALRTARREKLLPETVAPEQFIRLEQKLERYRRRIFRDTKRANDKAIYQQLWHRWKRLLRWMHWNIFRFGPRRWPRPVNIHRLQREHTRTLALSMVEPNVDPACVIHLADLARREVRRGRHGIKLRVLLDDQERTIRFFKDFLLERLGPEALKPEFQHDWIIASERGEKFRAAIFVEAD